MAVAVCAVPAAVLATSTSPAPALAECGNHVAERAQALVDRLCLNEALPGRLRLADALAPGQIHEVQLRVCARAADRVFSFRRDCDHEVRPRRVLVDVVRAYVPRRLAALHCRLHFLLVGDGHDREARRVDALSLGVERDAEIAVVDLATGLYGGASRGPARRRARATGGGAARACPNRNPQTTGRAIVEL